MDSSRSPSLRFPGDDSLPKRYRVRNSRATLREWQDILGSPILGLAGWMIAKATFGVMDKQVIDAPRPFRESRCEQSALPDRLRAHFEEIVEQGRTLGFGDPVYEMTQSSGVLCTGGAVLMRHPSGEVMLQSVASFSGPAMRGETHMVSTSQSGAETHLHCTSNGGPKYQRHPLTHVQYFRGRALRDLLESHRLWLAEQSVRVLGITTGEQVADLVDEMKGRFFQRMVERGIMVPVA